MYRRFFCGFLALLMLLGSAEAAQPDEELPDLVRLHVVADDDSAEAQSLKLEVRDACLACARELLADCESSDEAYALINENLEWFEKTAESVIRTAGAGEDAAAEAGIFPFPDRLYGETLVPAGDYRALRIVIGDGEGRNWWCVLYPSLCMESDDGYYSIIGRWLQRLFGGLFQ